jgi:Ner family transcriptional regulator
MARKPLGMHVEDVKASLRKKWGSLSALSRHLGRNSNAITQALAQPGYSVPLEREIAKQIGREPHEVWPDRFHTDGTPVSFRADRTPTAMPCSTHRQNEVAA